MSEDQAEYITDAVEMLGAGYEVASPPAEIFGALSGYTPTPDILCKKYGFITALVWGRMWRYCQGKDGVCRAKLETIAEGLGMSVRTIIRHIEKLIEGGYFEDKTPELRNKPHIYADTRKLRLAFSTEVIESGVTESHSAMTESHSQSDRESHEDSIKREVNKPLSAEKISKIKQSADKTVNAILDTERKVTGKTWTNLPEPYHAYGRAFCESTGLNYHKKYLSDWINTFDEWQTDGFQPADVRRAVEACRGKTDISRPGSITFKLRAQRAAFSVTESQVLIPAALTEDTSKFVPPPAHLRAKAHAATTA